MLKRWFLVGLVFLVSLIVVGCGVPQEEHDVALAERDTAQAEVASLQSELAEMQSDLATTESDLAETESDLATTQSEISSLQSQISSSQSQISSLRSDLSEAEGQVAELEKQIAALEGSQVGDLSPSFQLKDLDGKTVSLRELWGSPVMLNFWATWCGPCRNEMPYLQQIYEKWRDKGLKLLTINLMESTSTVRQFMQDNNYSLPILLDTNFDVGSKYDITAIPTSFFIDKYGVIREWKLGSFPSVEAIENSLSKIMPTQEIISLAGDKDGFGLGLEEGDERPTTTGGYGFNNREPDDPPCMDMMSRSDDLVYTHSFNLNGRTVISAELSIMTLGVQDGDTQVTGSDTDIRLFLDAMEVDGAFDDLDQFRYNGSAWVEIAGLYTISIPNDILSVLSDGSVEVRIQILQLGTSSSIDAIAIDFSELRIQVVD
jgi:thiol-disulfide isomerase/thioredoxin